MIEGLPLPATDDPLDSAYWAAAREGRLLVQTCADCGEARFPPRPMCPHCQSEEVAWRQDNGAATIWSFAVPNPPLLPAFEAMLPYVTVIAALESDPLLRIAGMAVRAVDGESSGITGADVSIGQRVQIGFRMITPECTLPVWRLEPTPTMENLS